MKLKRMMAAAACAALATALTATLAACGDDEPSGGGISAPDVSAIVSEKVTSEQWDSIFDYSGVTNVTMQEYAKSDINNITGTRNCIIKFDGNKKSEEKSENFPFGSSNETEYQAVIDNIKYVYEYDGEAKDWRRYEDNYNDMTDGYIDNYINDILKIIRDEDLVSNYMSLSPDDKYNYTYSDFEYKDNAYRLSATIKMFWEGDATDCVSDFAIKILNGRLVYFEQSIHPVGNKKNTEFHATYFYDFGTTSVTLPIASDNALVDPTDKPSADHSGTYYKYSGGSFDDRWYYVIDGEEAKAYCSEECQAYVDIAGSDITFTIIMDETYTQVSTGTINDGIINLTHHVMYMDGVECDSNNENQYFCQKDIDLPDSENDGTYYLYGHGDPHKAFFEFTLGNVIAYGSDFPNTQPVFVEVDGTDITMTFVYEDSKQVSKGTIADGIICLNNHKFYDLDDRLTSEANDVNYYCVNGVTPPVKESKELTVWVNSYADVYKDIAEEFLAEYEGGAYSDYTIKIEERPAYEVYFELNKSPKNGADVFIFDGAMIYRFYNSGMLLQLDSEYKNAVQERDNTATVEPAVINSQLYAFPQQAGNTIFMWYDSNIYDSEDLLTLDSVIEKARERGTKIAFPYNSSWYNQIFFFSTGCRMEYTSVGYYNDMNNEKGVIAAQSLYNYFVLNNVDGNIVNTVGADELSEQMKSGEIAACFSGEWMEYSFADYANIVPVKCPTFAADELGQVQMITPFSVNYFGVNAMSRNPELASALADYFTSENSQRLITQSYMNISTNKNVIASSDRDVVRVTYDQINIGGRYQTEQSQYFWEALNSDCIDNFDTLVNIKRYLDAQVEYIMSNL